jgi:hypothetical protein
MVNIHLIQEHMPFRVANTFFTGLVSKPNFTK